MKNFVKNIWFVRIYSYKDLNIIFKKYIFYMDESKLKSNYKKLKIKKFLFIFGWFLFSIVLFYIFLPYFIPIKLKTIPNSKIIYDKNWIQIWEIIIDQKYRHIETPLYDIPDFIQKSVIAIEDKSFYQNDWIDYKALFRAWFINITNFKNLQWGSTISSQLVRMNYWLNQKRTFVKKIHEFTLSLALNKKFSKQQILEKYLNTMYFGYLNYGIQSASKYYFGKTLDNLTKSEMIALLVLPKNPSKYDPYKNYANFKKRYDLLVDYLNKNNIFPVSEYNNIKNEALLFNTDHKNKLPYVVDAISLHYFSSQPNKIWFSTIATGSRITTWIDNSKFWSGTIILSDITTTVDYALSEQIQQIANNTINTLKRKNVNDYGLIIIDRHTGEVRVMIWWYDYYNKEGQVNSVLALRQMWSTLKPFTYLLAFKDKWLNPEDTIIDLPIQFRTSQWYSYTPKNFSLKYKWEVSIANALAESLNVPAVKVADMVGVSNLLRFYQKLWFSSLNKEADYYGLALTLGVWEVSLYELTRAYGIFANQWKLCDFKFLQWEADFCTDIIEDEFIEKIVYILTNRYFKINGFPINWNLDFPDRYVFVKTWTSREFDDNAAIGFSENYIIWVWVWNKDGSNMNMVTGVSGAWEIFRKIIYYLEKNEISNNFINLKINQQNYVEIISPVKDSVYKYDSKILSKNQKIKLDFSTNIDYTSYIRMVDWEIFKEQYLWLEPWKHTLQVVLYKEWKEVWKVESFFEVL